MDKDGCDLLVKDEAVPQPKLDHGWKLKRKTVFPKMKLPQLSGKITIQGYDLLLTCDTAPEQYDVFKQKNLVRYMGIACARF